MPLRSPKMYFCIFGFQRFVWWPKCTPASSSSFIVNAAMYPPSVCLRRAQQARLGRRGSPRDGQQRALPPKTRGVRDGELRRVLRVESHVFLAEIARPDAVLAATELQVDRDVVFRQSHDLPNPLHAHAFLQHPPLDQALVSEGDRDFLLLDAGRRFAERHHDPTPVGVLAVDRGLDQRRVRDGTRRDQRVSPARGAAHGDRHQFRRALAVGHEHAGELRHHRLEPARGLGETPRAPPWRGAFWASPCASPATVSPVDWSESTVVRLKDRSTARCTPAPSAPRATFASVATKQNIVARWGSSIATPLALPPIVTGRPPTSTRSADSLGRVSVVMMASAAPRPPWGDSDLASLGSAARILSIGSGTPMTPVDATSPWLAGIRSSSPTSRVISRASLMPCSPVQTLAQPLQATMAWACPPRTCSLDTTTGAPFTWFDVKTAAARAGVEE